VQQECQRTGSQQAMQRQHGPPSEIVARNSSSLMLAPDSMVGHLRGTCDDNVSILVCRKPARGCVDVACPGSQA
jgi:hypothetical protein